MNRRFSKRYGIDYVLLSDKKGRMANRFRIRNTDVARYDPHYGIAHPGVMVIDAQGRVRAKAAIRGYRERPSFESVHTLIVRSLDIVAVR